MSLSENIETFLAVVQTASISEAAKLLFVSQSTVSYRLKLLEDELECRLIDRSRGQGHCELTHDGQRFMLIAEKMRNIQHEITRLKNDTKVSVLRVGSAESIACYLFDELLNDSWGKQSKNRFEFTLGNTDSIFSMVASGRLDVGYVVYFKKIDGIRIYPIYAEEMVISASPGIFEPGSIIEPKDLNFEHFVQFNWTETKIGSWIDHWRNTDTSLYFATNAPCMAVNYMKNHRAWSLMPESMARRLNTELGMEIFRLTEPPPDRVCYRIASLSSRNHDNELLKSWDANVNQLIESKDFLKQI